MNRLCRSKTKQRRMIKERIAFIKIVSFITSRNEAMAFVLSFLPHKAAQVVGQIIKQVYAKHRYASANIYAAYLRNGKPTCIYQLS
jgi:hypothetical protein